MLLRRSYALALLLILLVLGCGGGGGGSASEETRWRVGPSGGTFSGASGGLELVVPSGALATQTTITVEALATAPTPPTGFVYVEGSGFSFSPTTFSSGATLSIRIPTGTPTAGLSLYRRADGETTWTPVATTVDGTMARASITTFSAYALFRPAGWTWGPEGGSFAFENLSVTVPAGAVTTTTNLQPRRTTETHAAPEGWAAVEGTSFDVVPPSTAYLAEGDLTVRISYAASALPEDVCATARVFRKSSATEAWTALEGSADPGALTVTGTTRQLGTFAVFYPVPSGPTFSIYWVEQRTGAGNQQLYEVFQGTSGGNETLAHSVPQMQGSVQMRVNTFRWTDRSFLGLEGVDSELYLTAVNVATGVQTRLFALPRSEGAYISSAEIVRVRNSNSPHLVLQVSERNPTTASNLNRLLRYRDGATTPEVLRSRTFADGTSIPLMRPTDINEAGQVLAMTTDGLILYGPTSQITLLPANEAIGDAFFSPDSRQVLAAGKRINLTTYAATPLPSSPNAAAVRWIDSQYVLTFQPIGPGRKMESLHVETGESLPIVSVGDRESNIWDGGFIPGSN
jgi:hypothetical protein